jgi:periplasmic divalent cation tolerance protein
MQSTDIATQIAVLTTTCPDAASAQQIAAAAVTEKLAACVQRLEGVQSTYAWQGEVRDEAEVLLMIKTLPHAVPALTRRILALHPYVVPELLVQTAECGNEAYLQWVRTIVFEPATSPSEPLL